MSATPLLIGPAESASLEALRKLAAARPVDIRRLVEEIKTPEGKAAHKHRMSEQTVLIPLDFAVTFSIETGHPIGTCQHMSMSTGKRGRVPTPEALWMVAEALGFVMGLDTCTVWLEDLKGHGQAVNLVQPLSIVVPDGATTQ